MFVNLPYRLAALRSITAARVHAMYQAIADVVNGQLDGRNFSRRARLPNELKAAPHGVFGVTVFTPYYWSPAGTLEDRAGRPRCLLRIPDGAGELGALEVVGWSATFGRVADALLVPGGSLTGGQVTLRRDGTLLDSVAVANPTVSGNLASRAIAAVAVQPGQVLEVALENLTFAGGACGERMTATVWLKAKHVR